MIEQDTASFYDDDDPSGGVVYDELYDYDGAAGPRSERRHMADIKRDLSHKSVPNLIIYGENVDRGMATNPTYASILARITAHATRLAALKAASKAVLDHAAEGKRLNIVLHNARSDYEDAHELLAKGAEGVNDTPEELTKAQFEIRQQGSVPVGLLPAPTNFHATTGDFEGQIDLGCDGDSRAAFWKGQRADTPEGPWHDVYQGTTSNWFIPGLPPGTVHWFRMCAHNSAGDSPWAGPISKRAP